ncbi:DJ-1/PfpI family protein [Polycladidibacter stylochi]|uniref:DJ-1/PfpI family protein n=1 Tax=Polycladidibacter stylochi TaxID=1807766 RepID=UPI00082F9414|nr:DJ-1/PfpI family protein [Pseudovibrio stylochi]
MSKLAIILPQKFADWEYAYLAGIGGAYYAIDLRFYMVEQETIYSQGGLPVTLEHSIEDLDAWSPQAVAVIGSTIWSEKAAPDITSFLSEQYNRGAVIAGICGGTIPIAQAGLLDNRPHTSNTLEFLKGNTTAYQGDAHYKNTKQAVLAQRVITAAGTAPISFSALLFESLGVDTNSIDEFKAMMLAEFL